MLAKKSKIPKHWAEHFRSVLNCSSAISDAAIDRFLQVDTNNDLDLPPSLSETIWAVHLVGHLRTQCTNNPIIPTSTLNSANPPSDSHTLTPGINSFTPTIIETIFLYSSPVTPTTAFALTTTITTTISDGDSLLNSPQCDRTFTSLIGLVGHLRIHRTETGEPFDVAECPGHWNRLTTAPCRVASRSKGSTRELIVNLNRHRTAISAAALHMPCRTLLLLLHPIYPLIIRAICAKMRHLHRINKLFGVVQVTFDLIDEYCGSLLLGTPAGLSNHIVLGSRSSLSLVNVCVAHNPTAGVIIA
ncbi:unnamed protein product [Schistocephalus solidus]|uniref:C2H2-type domain-containing protein n=1 Tax=Schistocephalus solidus TaxID=70667 RepID=A0A183TEF7_SCHSO|nr:unnamed protein product [Schistocephalus solidus]